MRKSYKRVVVAVVATLCAVIFAAGGMFAGNTARAASTTSTATNFVFTPNVITLNPGDSVTFQWGNGGHTATSVTGAWTSIPLNSGQTSGSTGALAAGTYYFYCSIHASAAVANDAGIAGGQMVGKIVVAAAAASPSPSASATTVTATPTTATATATPTTAPPTNTPTLQPTATRTNAPTQPSNAPINLTLTGANENPPVTSTGTGHFLATPSSNSLAFTLTGSGTATGMTMAHIHLGAPGTNGPIVAFLFGPNAAGVASINVSGTITQSDLIGPLAGDMAGFMSALQAGNLYVNIHTIANPNGELRAQIPGTPKAPATGSGEASVSSGPGPVVFFVLAGLAGVMALASVGSMLARRR